MTALLIERLTSKEMLAVLEKSRGKDVDGVELSEWKSCLQRRLFDVELKPEAWLHTAGQFPLFKPENNSR